MTALYATICSILMLAGIAGSIIPGLPGVPLAWLGFFIFAIGTSFERISIPLVIIFFVVMLLTLALDFLAPMLGAKGFKASRWGVFGAFVGFIVGTVLFQIPGIILGPLVGAFLMELIVKGRPKVALKSAFGTLLGYLSGTLIKIIVVLIMLGIFIASFF